jgi:hypothetical protein
MANVKIPELPALTSPSPSDLVPVADVSTANDEVKKTSVGEIVGIITGDVEVATDGTATISELPVSKLQDGAARQLLQTDAAGTGVEWTDDVDLPGTLDVTGITTLDDALNVAGLASLDGGIDVDGAFTVANSTGNVSTSGTLDVGSNGTIGGDLTVVGDLTVEGATTTLETQTLVVEDKNIELAVVDTPTDATADGGGITLKGATDKTFNWLDATDAWTSSEHIDLASGKAYYIGGAETLSATALGSAVVSSSLTSVGTLGTGTWEADTIAAGYGGTGQTTYTDGQLLIGTTAGGLAKATITAGDAISVTNGDGSITIAVSGLTDSEVSASAAIAGTKISPDFGSQNIATTGDIDIDAGLFKVASGTNAIGFYGATPVVQALAIAGITSTATTGSFPSTDGSVTIADAAAPTVTELLEYCVELESKLEAALTALRNLGLIAS